MFRLSVQYKGGAGMITARETLPEVMQRLDNIAYLDRDGGVIVQTITITREK